MQNRYSIEQLLQHMPETVLAFGRAGELIASNQKSHPLLHCEQSPPSRSITELFRHESVAAQVREHLQHTFTQKTYSGFLQAPNATDVCVGFSAYLLDSDTVIFSIRNADQAGRDQEADKPDLLEKRNRLLLALSQVTANDGSSSGGRADAGYRKSDTGTDQCQ